MEFRILGPLEVRDGDVAISFDAPKHRALLGVLLLHPDEVVSTERLIDELWGERPPPTAGKILQTYVSQLRKAVGPERILTQAPGYLLLLDDDTLDAVRFRRLVAEGRFREALELWRGPALADVVFESFARNEVERLEEERLGALMDRIDCDLALGRHDALVAELEALVRRYPVRERLRAQLMLALYRSGRQADALAAYQDARRTLDEELGLAPGRELQDLERAILNHDAALEPATRAPATPAVSPEMTRWRVLALAGLVVLSFASGVALAVGSEEPRSLVLSANSVGFVDAASGRITSSHPVGRRPSAILVAYDSVWVANAGDETVSRIDRRTGRAVTIVVGGHPAALTAHLGAIWAWTAEGLLVPIDPRYDRSGEPVSLATLVATSLGGVAPDTPRRREGPGGMASGGGSLWLTVPLTSLIRVDPARPEEATVILPDDGVRAAILHRDGAAWVAGYDSVFRIDDDTGIAGARIRVGLVRDLAFGAGSLWVVSGGRIDQGVRTALRRVDARSRLVEAEVAAGDDPVAVATAAGSIWVAGRSDRAIRRVDPRENRVVDTIPLGAPARPRALAADDGGVWVVVG